MALLAYADVEDTDQTAHMRSLICVFAVCSQDTKDTVKYNENVPLHYAKKKNQYGLLAKD